MKGVTWPVSNSTMHSTTRRVSPKAKSSRSLKGADMLVWLLPLACAFESSDLKAQLLLGYLLTTRLWCDNKVSFPHLYVLEVWHSRMRLCYNKCCHIPRLFHSKKTSTVTGWFLVMCFWSNLNVSRTGHNRAVCFASNPNNPDVFWDVEGNIRTFGKTKLFTSESFIKNVMFSCARAIFFCFQVYCLSCRK